MGIKGFFCIQCVCKDTYTGYPVLTTEPFNWQGNIEMIKSLTMKYFEILLVFQMKYVLLKIQKLVMECVIQKLLFSIVVTMMLEIVQVQDLN